MKSTLGCVSGSREWQRSTVAIATFLASPESMKNSENKIVEEQRESGWGFSCFLLATFLSALYFYEQEPEHCPWLQSHTHANDQVDKTSRDL